MPKTTEEVCNEIILAQLALDDPEQFGDVDSITPDTPAGVVLQFARTIVRQTLQTCADDTNDANDTESKEAVSVVLGQLTAKLASASAALCRSALIAGTGSTISPLADGISPKQSAKEYKTYFTLLEALAVAIACTETAPGRFPMTKRMLKEAKILAPVFGFLAERRHQLRCRIHSCVLQPALGDSIGEMSADRGDEIAAMYHTLVVASILPEEPENWTLRDKPEELRRTLTGLLSDLHHLADAAEMNWRKLLATAQQEYRDELRE